MLFSIASTQSLSTVKAQEFVTLVGNKIKVVVSLEMGGAIYELYSYGEQMLDHNELFKGIQNALYYDFDWGNYSDETVSGICALQGGTNKGVKNPVISYEANATYVHTLTRMIDWFTGESTDFYLDQEITLKGDRVWVDYEAVYLGSLPHKANYLQEMPVFSLQYEVDSWSQRMVRIRKYAYRLYDSASGIGIEVYHSSCRRFAMYDIEDLKIWEKYTMPEYWRGHYADFVGYAPDVSYGTKFTWSMIIAPVKLY